jgi:hypothetical protein
VSVQRNGAAILRDIINLFVGTYNGTEIFQAIAANPFITFLRWRPRAGVPLD